MNKIKLKFPKNKIIYHIIDGFIGVLSFNNKIDKEYFLLNSTDDYWKRYFKIKYEFLNEGNNYKFTKRYFNKKIGKYYKIYESYEKDSEEIEKYIYRDLEGQELIDMIDFLYNEIFSLEILPGDPKYFGEDYWGNNTELFHNIVSQIDYRKLKISEIDQLKDIITKNYKRSKVTEDTYNEVLRELERKKVTAIKD
ncbi:MAG: hypothetical protein PHS49_04365 [Candidatus Gracilibacteria bacterium]|nr:hypothetical protein [Candidatus Gracilibacteria bacterium]